MMDRNQFAQACENVRQGRRTGGGIGTLGEGSLHAVLKQYMDPCGENHETQIGPFVADIVGENGIIEIQTRGFDKMRKKLAAFLEVSTVTIVYPVVSSKWLVWLDTETGELLQRRKSPKHGNLLDVFEELYKIKMFLTHPNLRLHLLVLELEEYRIACGAKNSRRRRSVRYERAPLQLLDELVIDCPRDYPRFLPPELPESFTSRDLQAHGGVPLGLAQLALNVLHHVGAVTRTGKRGRLYTYQIGGNTDSCLPCKIEV